MVSQILVAQGDRVRLVPAGKIIENVSRAEHEACREVSICVESCWGEHIQSYSDWYLVAMWQVG